ncbi:hypothetical protein WMY93_005443 [Mugilogobius chulae]|uniref:Uncharacterized protein n=1 Tax=Mugilogobius chulae TaxID=88201 RepID=A0AAW0PGT5_9GOBI
MHLPNLQPHLQAAIISASAKSQPHLDASQAATRPIHFHLSRSSMHLDPQQHLSRMSGSISAEISAASPAISAESQIISAKHQPGSGRISAACQPTTQLASAESIRPHQPTNRQPHSCLPSALKYSAAIHDISAASLRPISLYLSLISATSANVRSAQPHSQLQLQQNLAESQPLSYRISAALTRIDHTSPATPEHRISGASQPHRQPQSQPNSGGILSRILAGHREISAASSQPQLQPQSADGQLASQRGSSGASSGAASTVRISAHISAASQPHQLNLSMPQSQPTGRQAGCQEHLSCNSAKLPNRQPNWQHAQPHLAAASQSPRLQGRISATSQLHLQPHRSESSDLARYVSPAIRRHLSRHLSRILAASPHVSRISAGCQEHLSDSQHIS